LSFSTDRISFPPKASPPTWNSLRTWISDPHRRDRANLQKTTSFTDAFIPKENILLIEGRYDLLVEAEQTEELWQKWKQPEIWRLSHGHISWMFTPGLKRRILCWLAPRMN